MVEDGPNAHGGLLREELEALGLVAEEVLDLSVNVNPYGPCEPLLRAIAAAPLDRYPEPAALPARRALAQWLGVGPGHVVLGNGAVDLLWSLARLLLGPGRRALIIEPTFAELRRAAEQVGAEVQVHRTRAEQDFALDLVDLHRALARIRPALAYVCSPANPAGRYTSLEALAELAALHPATCFVVDVSFLSLSAHSRQRLPRSSGTIVWVQSLTKDLALPGLRVGFAIAPEPIARALERARPPWSINALAQAAAIATMSPAVLGFVESSRQRLLADRQALETSLRALDLRVHASDTLYSLVDLGAVKARELRKRLLVRHRIMVRACDSFGLPHHIRVCAHPEPERERFVRALATELRCKTIERAGTHATEVRASPPR